MNLDNDVVSTIHIEQKMLAFYLSTNSTIGDMLFVTIL